MPLTTVGLGGGMIVNGLLNALVSSINSRRSISANAEQQKKNAEFQEALQKKQWRHAENLQKEMREMTRQNFLEQLEHQKQTADFQSLDQRWPLPACSPRSIVKEFNDYLRQNLPIPLQLIIVENGELAKAPLSIKSQVRHAINELNKFMSQHYNRNSQSAVKIYDTSKAGSNFGSAEINTLFEVFKVAPTMVLTIRVHGAEYIMECWYWGCGQATHPMMVEIYRCNVDDLQLSVLSKIAEDWTITKTRLGVTDPDKDALVDLLNRLASHQKELENKGATEAEIREYGRKPYLQELSAFTSGKSSVLINSRKIDAIPFISSINQGIERSVLSSFKICATLLSDAHFLLEYNEAPKFMQICTEELTENPGLLKLADDFFTSAMDALPDYQSSEKALMYARMASSYQNANNPQKALSYCQMSAQRITNMVSPDNFVYEATDEMRECVAEIQRINGAQEKLPWINQQATRTVSPDDFNKHAASLYQRGKINEAINVWKNAASHGHIKSIHNLANVLNSLHREEEANEMYAKAIKLGDTSLFDRGHHVALWLCSRGDWETAFIMWTAYLQSHDETYKMAALAYSAITLFTDAYRRIPERELDKWCDVLGTTRDETTVQSIAEDLLLSLAEGKYDSQKAPFYDVLGAWYIKSKGGNIPLIFGGLNNVDIIFKLPDRLPSDYERKFTNYCSWSARHDIKTNN